MSFEASKFPFNERISFSAFADSTGQIGTATTDTKVTFNDTRWNIGDDYNTSTSTFTPSIAGYYQLEARVSFTSANAGYLAIYKNGSRYKVARNASTPRHNHIVSAVVHFNGSTDDAHIVMNLTSPAGTVSDSEPYNWFAGYLIRAT